MLTTCVHFQLGQHSASQRPSGHHALNGFLDGALRGLLYQVLKADSFNAANVSGVVIIDLISCLFADYVYLLGINHHDVVTGVHMGSVLRLVLSAQAIGNLSGHTAQSFARCIDDEPVTSDCFSFSTICLHVIPASGGASHSSGGSSDRCRPVPTLLFKEPCLRLPVHTAQTYIKSHLRAPEIIDLSFKGANFTTQGRHMEAYFTRPGGYLSACATGPPERKFRAAPGAQSCSEEGSMPDWRLLGPMERQ